jgi:translation elongation factor EF-1alpha
VQLLPTNTELVFIIKTFSFILVKDMGTVIIGKLESGVIQKGENVAVMPNRVSFYFKLLN